MAVLRAIGAVVAGYIVIGVLVVAGLAVAAVVLGDGAYQEGGEGVSTLWLGASLAVGLVAALVAGLVCAFVAAPRSQAPFVFAGLVLIGGVVYAAQSLTADETQGKPKEPLVFLVLNPLVGVVGVLAGARLRPGPRPA